MTEQEIIQYLKDNKDYGKGVPLGNMPEEVREWIERKFKPLEDILVMTHDMDWCPINDFLNLPFALSDNYELPQKPSGKWVEFDINTNGDFEISGFRNDRNITVIYNWTQWNKPIRDNASKNFVNGCCAFGGWQYKEEPGLWTLSPMAGKDDSAQNFYGADLTVKPIIPVKIRFWRNINDD